jgi:hypothetical protein
MSEYCAKLAFTASKWWNHCTPPNIASEKSLVAMKNNHSKPQISRKQMPSVCTSHRLHTTFKFLSL